LVPESERRTDDTDDEAKPLFGDYFQQTTFQLRVAGRGF
jgi:hypothetical protein